MTIAARYIDTCLPDYLLDHHNRPGEMLVGAYLGMTLSDTVEDMLHNMDDDAALPSYDQDELKRTVRNALVGVDLRMVDTNGNRSDVPVADVSDEDMGNMSESQVWVLLTWDATVIKMRLTVDIEYQANGADSYDLKLVLENLIRFAASDGALQGGTEAVVTSWGATALDVTNDPEVYADPRLRTAG
jgi:hypothetical protein